MKIGIVGHHEIEIARAKSSPHRLKNVPLNLVQVELCGEEIVFEVGAKNARVIAHQSAGRGWSKMCHRRHEVAGALQTVNYTMNFRVNTAVNGVDQRIAFAAFRVG